MSNRFGTNSPIYDLSRLMTFAMGQPPQNVFSAPIILDNPAITSGIALFSHTAQPFSVAVPALAELRLFDLDFANTGLATSQFYGIKIQTNADVVDTGAGIAIFNAGRADSIYLNVAGKDADAVGNSPTGVGIDINKEITSSAERDAANSSQQGIQIFDWSTTNQGIGGPRGILIQKQSELNTDHLLMTLRSNRNALQFVVAASDGIYDGTEILVRIDDEDSGNNLWLIRQSGEQVFTSNGIGIQWLTGGGDTAYILSSTKDLKLKSGGTGIRFVNEADTQTIVMMQDDLTVDIPNGEVRFKALKIIEDRLENWATNALGAVSVSYNGYNGGTTQWRDFKVFDGKQGVVAIFEGSTASLTVTNKITIGATTNATTNALIVNGQGTNTGSVPARYNAYLFDTTAFAAGVGSGLALGGKYGAANTGFFGIISAKKVNGTDGNATGVMDLTVSKSDNTQISGIKILSDGTNAAVLLNSLIYGGMYGDNISQSVTISATDTHYEVGGGLSGGSTYGVTFQNSKELLIATAGIYLITYSISVQCASANQEVEASVMVNSTASARLSAHAGLMTANTPEVLSGSQPISLAANDVVKFCVANHTATNNLTVSHANMSIVRIGA